MTTTKKKAKRKGFPYKDALERLIQKSRLGARRTTELETTCVALSDRLTALAAQVNEVISGMQGFDMRLTGTRERLTALEQAQRPASPPGAEKRAGPWVSAGRHAHRKCTKGMPVCAVETLFSGQWQAWAVNADSQVTHWWGTQYATEAAARAACDAELVRLGWTLDAPSAPAPSEEDRLRDAVVDAALAWGLSRALNYNDAVDKLAAAVKALRAHRAKKGERDAIPPKS